jgi:hypothetical protein
MDLGNASWWVRECTKGDSGSPGGRLSIQGMAAELSREIHLMRGLRTAVLLRVNLMVRVSVVIEGRMPLFFLVWAGRVRPT